MKTRAEIKMIARDMMAQQRSVAICSGLIAHLALPVLLVMVMIVPILGSVASIVGRVAMIVVGVSYSGIFIDIYRGIQTRTDALMDGLNINFGRKLGSMFCVGLFTALWSILFIIPGIIKGLSYSFTPFILTEFPNVGAMDAIKVSQKLTSGHKMQLFILNLSFIGWHILSIFTLGILTYIYVLPYLNTSVAGYYTEVLNRAIEDGTITYEELGIMDTRGEQYSRNFN